VAKALSPNAYILAEVIDDAENVRLAAWMNDVPAVILNIQRQPGANIIKVVDRIKDLLPKLKASLPASVELTILTDRTTAGHYAGLGVQLFYEHVNNFLQYGAESFAAALPPS
jgi:hypothetical protein